MSTRRDSTVYFGILLVACAMGYVAANRSVDVDPGDTIPDFAGFGEPLLVLEPPIEFPFPMLKFETRIAPTLVISDDVESTLLEVRTALLTSAIPIDVSRIEELAAVTD